MLRLFYLLLFINPFFIKSYAQIIDHATDIIIDKNTITETHTITLQVNNSDERHLSDIHLTHGRNEEFNINEAFILDNSNNVIRKLKKKEIKTKSTFSRSTYHNDYVTKEFSLHWTKYPYRIKYSYTTKANQYLYIANWNPYNKRIETQHASLSVVIPSDIKFRIHTTPGINSSKQTNGAATIYKWSVDSISKTYAEHYSPHENTYRPAVLIIPLQFNYSDIGNTESWKTFGEWIEKINAGTSDLTVKEKTKIDTLLKGIQNPRKKIQLLYHYLQDNTRYVNVTIEDGGLRPYPASYVCTNKYGDCKALTIYMKVLLEYAGITSSYTLIHAGKKIKPIKTQLPSQQFNHVVLTVPFDNDTLWIENTSKYLPLNYTNTFTQNRNALVVDQNKSKIIKSPKLSIADVETKTQYNFKLDATGTGKVALLFSLKGPKFDQYIRNYHLSSNKEQLDQIKEDCRLKNFEITDWNFNHQHRDSTTAQIIVNGTCQNIYKKINSLTIISPINIKVPKLENPTKRKNSVHIPYPTYKTVSTKYQINTSNYQPIQLPENQLLSSRFGTFKITYSMSNNTISMNQSFQLYDGNYNLDTYPDLYQFVQEIKELQKKSALILNQ